VGGEFHAFRNSVSHLFCEAVQPECEEYPFEVYNGGSSGKVIPPKGSKEIILKLVESNCRSISLYPNPGNGLFSVKKTCSSIQYVSVYSFTGALIKECKEVNSALDLTELQDGAYLVKLTLNNNSVVSKKVMINHN
jgi:hypothetical protein